MSRRTEMLLKNMEFVGYNDLNKKPGFQMGMHRTEDGPKRPGYPCVGSGWIR